jgi:glycosyltransferase involved in cell wall biosynthesis
MTGAGNGDVTAAWSVILPYFNEERFILATLHSLVAQSLRPLRLILVNNASTDHSENLARTFLHRHPGIDAAFLDEPRQGKIWALKTGLAHVTTRFVATCDADTFYPPDYIDRCDRLFADSGADTVAAMAINLNTTAATTASIIRRTNIMLLSRLFYRMCHSGGFAQAFRTGALRAVGGFDPLIWPYVLEDHEIIQRLLKLGKIAYAFDHWCMPSDRRSDRSRAHWTWNERLLYTFTPFNLKDWFFYSFLAQRFTARGLLQRRLREQCWNA